MPRKTQKSELEEAITWILQAQHQQEITNLLFALQSHANERALLWRLNRYAKQCAIGLRHIQKNTKSD